ncbi:N-acetylmuramoyl-L-alanine amidase [Palleronia caenipelagi]|uniref:N-acetylmuramoyl-L-alanine amidase n=1 Tax=Palleronia caenipelagi TaxID=2489174 RepID=A0A547Q9M5_9RHOB|nr:N-acetylmuramoyl-L-alanine amidase [Palleronia caenipelagi]TRD23093.1 N-acetylmuramoyl-L-alanine amidase [Palleronia caenipelagi]
MIFRTAALGLVLAGLTVAPVRAATEPVMSTFMAETSLIEDFGSDLHLRLHVSRPVPWRVFTLTDPLRLVLDFAEVDFSTFDPATQIRSDAVTAVRVGRFQPGWSRMVLTLAEPMKVETAGLSTTTVDGAMLKIQLAKTTEARFEETAGAPPNDVFRLKSPEPPAILPERDRLLVAIDPGHGGFDPGAQAGGMTEANLMLMAARDLKTSLEAVGIDVLLTRDEDTFLPLTTRVGIARAAGAHLFVSLHADALPTGSASGAAVYTLSETASDAASRKLAERLSQDDLIAGVDLGGADDDLSVALMDMVRRDTRPRSDALAAHIVRSLDRRDANLHKRPRLQADFAVLRAADIPSVLVELGFLSDPQDRIRLMDAEARARTVAGIRDGILAWARTDDAASRLMSP